MYKRILVPLDGTFVDDAIIEHLKVLGKIHDSKVYLIRVLHYHTRDELSYQTEEAKDFLERKKRIFNDIGIQCNCIIEYGEPEKIIPEKAVEINADLIAMATHGHNWLVDILFGSVAHKVRHTVSIPVLMVRGKH